MSDISQPMSTIYLDDEHLQHLQAHARRAYPRECCGLFLGQREDATARVREVWDAENVWDDDTADLLQDDRPTAGDIYTQERRYVIAPERLLAAQKTARDRGWQVLGFYHSHPDHPAVPSECDRQWAWSDYLYLIVSVRGQEPRAACDSQCWQLDGDRQFQPVPIALSDAAPGTQPETQPE